MSHFQKNDEKPVIIIQCGHSCSEKHLKIWCEKNSACPSCKTVSPDHQYKTNLVLKELIDIVRIENSKVNNSNNQKEFTSKSTLSQLKPQQ
jgi:hypothetical protein